MTVECEHGIRQYVRRGIAQPACQCHLSATPTRDGQMPRLDVKNCPVAWPWLYGTGDEK